DNTTFYGEGELSKTITKDENWSSGQTHDKDHTVEEFTDKLGRVVLKRTYDENVPHDTFYVYDDFGNLTYVLSPKTDVSDGVSQTELNELGYQYVYDHRNRLVRKKLPGKGWESIVYNKLDQPVMTQDANLDADDQWLFTKYDPYGRLAYTGVIHIAASREALQTNADNASTQYELWQGTPNTMDDEPVYYGNSAFPSNSLSHPNSVLHTVNYYDSYTDTDGLTIPNTVLGQGTISDTKGLPTVSKVRVLETDDWITTVTGYDAKGRVIFTHSKNPYLETEDITEFKLDFTGRILESRTTHKKTGNSDIVIVDIYNYDHMGRNVDHYQTINGSSQELIASNSYDGIGQLQTKSVGNQKTNPLQSVDHKYNIRGWLTAVNDPAETDDLYAFGLQYNQTNTNAQPLFNGNISAFFGATPGATNSGSTYAYEYDALNRLTDATDVANNGRYNVEGITYDPNGNILTLKRYGKDNTNTVNHTYGLIDDLVYEYLQGGNQLKVVSDIAANERNGFRDDDNNPSIETYADYGFDANGNLVNDSNLGIRAPIGMPNSGILYNHLNLPQTIYIGEDFRKTVYTYDANGNRLKKDWEWDSTSGVMDYAGNFVYENGILQFFNHPEGYATPNNSGGYDYVYQYKDHVDNVRLSFTEDPSNLGQAVVIEENAYYPFGGLHQGTNFAGDNALGNDVAQRWKFGGKELEQELTTGTYDFGARNYDPWLGRWMNIDPLAEQMRRHSPYNYAFNNPVYFMDPDGMSPEGPCGKKPCPENEQKNDMPPDAQRAKSKVDNLLSNIADSFDKNYEKVVNFFSGKKEKNEEQKSNEGKITRDGITVYGEGGDSKAGDGIVTGHDRGNGGSISVTGEDINPFNTLLSKSFQLPENLTNVISIDVNLADEALLIEYMSNNTGGIEYYGGDTNLISISSSNEPSADSTSIMQTTQKKQYRTSGTLGTDSIRVIRRE
ncbi:MAG: RHS repeat-associated core domain-containing protein, partial [Bacteroidota bacterium]